MQIISKFVKKDKILYIYCDSEMIAYFHTSKYSTFLTDCNHAGNFFHDWAYNIGDVFMKYSELIEYMHMFRLGKIDHDAIAVIIHLWQRSKGFKVKDIRDTV